MFPLQETIMSYRFVAAVAVGFLAAPFAARAADQTVLLTVHHTGCVLCAPIVKSTLAHVKGVKAVKVSQPDAMADVAATVTFDDAETTTAALIKATTDHGYPAELKKTASNS
jgi:mercuric ion binding protein